MKYTNTYIEDLQMVSKTIKNIDMLKGKKVLVAGATGMIGSGIVDILMNLNMEQDYDTTVYAASRNQRSSKKRFLRYEENSLFKFVFYDTVKELQFPKDIDFIIYAACYADPNEYNNHPVEIMMSNFLGMSKIFEYSRNNGIQRVVYISSSEIYGIKEENTPYSETDYGFVDISNPRMSYASSKRATETLCASYLKEYNIPYIIARPGHIYGPTVLDSDTKASSQFARAAKKGENIILKSKGSQIRSYCYVLDCASAILSILINGDIGEAYNISNKDSVISIRQLAEEFAKAAGVKVEFENPSMQEKQVFNPMDNSSLNSSKIERIGWSGMFSPEMGVRRTLEAI